MLKIAKPRSKPGNLNSFVLQRRNSETLHLPLLLILWLGESKSLTMINIAALNMSGQNWMLLDAMECFTDTATH